MATIKDDDLMLVNRNNISYKVTGAEVKESLDPGPPPLTLTAEISPLSAETGDTLTAFGTAAGGTEPYSYTYQWYKKLGSITNTTVPGATQSTYTIPSDGTGYQYRCLISVTDDAGNVVNEFSLETQPVTQGASIKTPEVLYPPDGAGIGGDETYTPKTSPVTDVEVSQSKYESVFDDEGRTFKGIASAKGKFCAYTQTRSGDTVWIYHSSDGITWEPSSMNIPPSSYGSGGTIAGGDDGFVAIQSGEFFYHSSDGTNFTRIFAPYYTSWQNADWSEEMGYVACASKGFGADNGFAWSDNGINWDYSTYGTNDEFKDVACGKQICVAVATSGAAIWFPDPRNGNYVNASPINGLSGQFYTTSYGDGKFIIKGQGTAVYFFDEYLKQVTTKNLDGKYSDTYFNSTLYADGVWMLGTGGNKQFVLTSSDGGDTWVESPYPGDQYNGYGMAYLSTATNKFAITTQPGILSSKTAANVDFANLTLTDSSTYNVDTNTDMGQPISETFSPGQAVTGVKNGSDPAGGTVVSVSGNEMTVEPNGDFVDGMEVVNTVQATRYGPDSESFVLVGSTPAFDPPDFAGTFYSVDWEISHNGQFNGSADMWTRGALIVPNQNQVWDNADLPYGVAPFTELEPDTQYWLRVKYTSNDLPNFAVSDVVTFKTRKEEVNVDDVFIIDTYSGLSNIQIRNAGVDYTNGGLFWVKSTTSSISHALHHYGLGEQKYIASDSTTGLRPTGGYGDAMSLTDNGVFLGGVDITTVFNSSSSDYVSWSFLKSPGFFDVVEYIGNSDGTDGQTQVVPHSLGSTPGVMIIKGLDSADNWNVYHQSVGNTKYGRLQMAAGFSDSPRSFNSTSPTDSNFTVGWDPGINKLGERFVAYLFADTPGLIKCGGFTTDGSGNATENVGFETQWLLFKWTDGGSWYIQDDKRGFDSKALLADTTDDTQIGYPVTITSDSFSISGAGPNRNYVYIAIAKGGSTRFFDTEAFKTMTDREVTDKYGVDPYTANLEPLGIKMLTEEPVGVTETFVPERDKINPIECQTNKVASLNREISEAHATIEELETSFLARIQAIEQAIENNS